MIRETLLLGAAGLASAAAVLTMSLLLGCNPCRDYCEGFEPSWDEGTYSASGGGEDTVEFDSVDVGDTDVVIHLSSGDDVTYEITLKDGNHKM
jgi:hypothetical protein